MTAHTFRFEDFNPVCAGPFHYEAHCSCGEWQSHVVFSMDQIDVARDDYWRRHVVAADA